eukprot:CAMPEP_0172423680 /NCGR_PEP_ID=MMETSP1064-20121228/17657_1 /TAXON_ID=202472 /ORGANISM="Aulacoseira subarctica , Strain CCAP 1002/5" /LENGTH=184 /DNA_ID=CAMNT_0013165161 /DNA_START=40 /DNA_END=594 /DNA_ORIENTATION=+
MKLSCSFLPLFLVILVSYTTAQDQNSQNVSPPEYYGDIKGGQEYQSDGQTDSNHEEINPSQTAGRIDATGASDQVDASSAVGQEVPAHVVRHKTSTGASVANHEVVDYSQEDPNPYNNEYPCQGPWYECVGMDKLEAFAYIKERLKYCGDTDTRVMMFAKADGLAERIFAHVNSDGTVTKVAAA